ncbi:Stearoyl-CoA 9-desaturase [Aphelenchoides besseyi]|nr:Stearoyl-CoA 9-desaturase [Aphelenchoides besseyi]KAI6211871.1 Stearoyl-CoA 9-desaturase [Aphelenchoides besseyi]
MTAGSEMSDLARPTIETTQKAAAVEAFVQRDEEALESVRIKINGKWLLLTGEFVANHPGGSVIYQYKDSDATQIFDAFHEGSATAYKQLAVVEKRNEIQYPTGADPTLKTVISTKEVNVGVYDLSLEQEKKIVRSFEALKKQVTMEGLMDERPWYFARKVTEVAGFMLLAFFLQYHRWYIASALSMAMCWQQLGWLTHEVNTFCHHQPFKNRRYNDWWALILGNLAQGFSRDWWKDKHNTHHAATNIIEQDGDIDLAPLIAMVPEDLVKYRQPIEQFFLKFIPYQHFYFTFTLPLLRVSWVTQSLIHVFQAPTSRYTKDRSHATIEQYALLAHWSWVVFQLYLLPDMTTRLTYFAISQLLSGTFIALVVTFNHNSLDKYPEGSRLLNNFAALHILTTRNMNPGPFVDWFWGGLNYQIEHHLFPTMPRPNLTRCSELVREFCYENGLPYMVDDYKTGYLASLRLLENVSKLAEKQKMLVD